MPVLENEILPAVIASNQQELDEMLEKIVEFAENIMLDLMDGKFVPASSLDFNMILPPGPKYQFHVMAVDPINRIMRTPDEVDTVILHAESLDSIDSAISAAKDKEVKLFIALNPETDIDIVKPHLSELEGVLIMSVHPGQYGAKFLPEQLKKVKSIRELSKTINIEVDGGMNDRSMVLAVAAGANQIASGSYIMKNKDPEAAYNRLMTLF